MFSSVLFSEMKKIKLSFALLSVLVTLGLSAPTSCPSAEHLHPCTCKRLAFGLMVQCRDFNDISNLIQAFKVLRDYEVHTVVLRGLKMTERSLPIDIFDGLKISQMRVEKCKLEFSGPAFRGLDETLQVLNVAQHSMIKSSEDFIFATLNKLTDLSIKSSPVRIVRDKWLNGKIPNVRNIRLDEDDIEALERHAFTDLHNLESISIAENKIKTVERSMFPRSATELKKIDLSGNELKSLPSDFFFDMPKLEDVILSGNDISTLSELTWKSVWEQLNSVLLYENTLICDERLKWMKGLRWPRQVLAHCESPNHLKGMALEEVYKT